MTTAIATTEPVEQFLANIQGARNLLAEATELPDVKHIRDKASALQHFAESARFGLEAQNFAAILKIEAERKAGQLLKVMEKNTGRYSTCVSLTQLGIKRKQSSNWQRMSDVTDEELTGLIDRCNSCGKEITTAAVLKLANKSAAKASIPVLDSNAEGITDNLDSLVADGKTFKTIYADPPWQYDNQGTRAATSDHYGTMTVDAICKLPVDLLADERSILFLWTTNGFLRQSFDVIDAWGFEFKSSMVWIKMQMGIGNYVRNSHELLLIATRGGAIPADARKKQISWISASRTKHSAKPNAFRRVVETLGYPDRLELFGRSRADGWTVYGNQISTQPELIV